MIPCCLRRWLEGKRINFGDNGSISDAQHLPCSHLVCSLFSGSSYCSSPPSFVSNAIVVTRSSTWSQLPQTCYGLCPRASLHCLCGDLRQSQRCEIVQQTHRLLASNASSWPCMASCNSALFASRMLSIARNTLCQETE